MRPSPIAIRSPLAVCTLLWASALSAQSQWLHDQVMWPRSFHALARDPGSGDLIAFGGSQANLNYSSTWAFDGSAWSFAGTMPAGGEMEVVHDPVRGRFYAARGSNTFLSWDGTNWAYEASAPTFVPAGRWLPVWDPIRQVTTLVVSGPAVTELYDWNGFTWTPRSTAAVSPPWNVNGRVVHDPATGAILSLTSFPPGTPLQIWAFDGSAWQQRVTATQPPPLEWFAVGRDPLTNHLLVHGGYESINGQAVSRDQLWAYDGVDWHVVNQGAAPAARYAHAMANDPTTGRLLLYGGNTFAQGEVYFYGDLWAWNGLGWTKLLDQQAPALTGAPSQPYTAAVAFDRRLQQIVGWPIDAQGSTQTFDGAVWRQWPCGGTCPQAPAYLALHEPLSMPMALASNGALLWDGVAWSPLTAPTGGPVPMPTDAAIASDGTRLLLFGGMVNGSPTNATWAWDLGGWTRLFPPTSPPPMAGHRMASVPRHGGILLVNDSATWSWDGNTWQFRGPAPITGRIGVALAYLPERDRVVLHGGIDTTIPGNPVRNNAWEWDGLSWQLMVPGLSPARANHRLVEGPQQRLWLLPDAGTEFYSYASVHQAVAEPFGAGCAGSNGVPQLSARAWERPRLLDSFAVQLDAVPSNGAILALGFRDDQWSGLPLPLLLDFVGMFGCQALLELDSLYPTTSPGGHADWTFAVPNTPSLLDLSFFLQAVAVDGAANPAGLTTSNGLRGRLGQR